MMLAYSLSTRLGGKCFKAALFATGLFFLNFPVRAQDTKDIETVLVATLEVIKQVITKQLSQEELKEFNDKAAKLYPASSSRTFEKFSPTKVGWMLKNRGYELQVVTFSYEGNRPQDAEYLDAILPLNEAGQLYAINKKIFTNRFRQLQDGKYDIGGTYTAQLSFFKGSSGKGRSVIRIAKAQ